MAREILIVTDEWTPLDLLLFRRFREEVPGRVEAALDSNPGLSASGVFLPLGATVVVDVPVPVKGPTPARAIRLWD
ncbi:phage tail protein [Pseudoxanthobacter sp. M-2]|uniref:tail protein X n=1 Tax=Pseudoxanthobacter sp. M-2 TaxID=3078754 RepID=UPI0038FCB4E0